MLINMAVSSDRKVTAPEVEKISKYKDLEIEISKNNLKTTESVVKQNENRSTSRNQQNVSTDL